MSHYTSIYMSVTSHSSICMSVTGHTIVGDYTYSNRADVRPHRMMLHSLSLTIPMQPLSENVCITAPDPFTTDSKWCPQKVHVTTEQLVSQLTL